MTSHTIRKILGLSQNELAIAFDIPVSTVRNWDSKDCMPIYIYEMLSYIAFYDNDVQKHLRERIRERAERTACTDHSL